MWNSFSILSVIIFSVMVLGVFTLIPTADAAPDVDLYFSSSQATALTSSDQSSVLIADYERENPLFKEDVKLTITPMISSLSILNYVDMNSEASVLGYGISLILLNGLMYVGLSVGAIILIKRK